MNFALPDHYKILKKQGDFFLLWNGEKTFFVFQDGDDYLRLLLSVTEGEDHVSTSDLQELALVLFDELIATRRAENGTHSC